VGVGVGTVRVTIVNDIIVLLNKMVFKSNATCGQQGIGISQNVVIKETVWLTQGN